MADVAAHLGISRQLVSIVMRDMPGASDTTRKRVREAASRLGYQPHTGARSLRQTRSTHLGVLFAPAHAPETDIVEAIYPAASQHGYQVVLSAQTATRSTVQAVEQLTGFRCAALIVIGSDLPEAKMRQLARRVTVPLVVVGAGKPNRAYDIVRSAGETGIAAMVDHLLSLGHSRIAYVHVASMAPAGPRRQGYLDAMGTAGAEADIVTIPGEDYTEEAGAAAARILLDRPELPTAVVAGNDQQAVGVITVLSRAGVSIPGRVSVTGFDDSRSARLSSIDLTTARQDPVQMGRAAVEAAVRRIDQPDQRPSTALIEPSSVLRSSTATAPAD